MKRIYMILLVLCLIVSGGVLSPARADGLGTSWGKNVTVTTSQTLSGRVELTADDTVLTISSGATLAVSGGIHVAHNGVGRVGDIGAEFRLTVELRDVLPRSRRQIVDDRNVVSAS